MDSMRLLLFLATAVAFITGINWLFYSLGILLLCVLFLDVSGSPAPKARKAVVAAGQAEGPVIIQNSQDNSALHFYNELLSTVIKDALDSSKK